MSQGNGIERTYWEGVNKECTRNHDPFRTFHRTFRSLQEFVFVGFNIQSVCDTHDEHADYTWR